MRAAFIRTDIPSPLLCLTATATLRPQALTSTPRRRELMALITAAEPLPSLSYSSPSTVENPSPDDDDDPTNLRGFDEVNLLDGLATGIGFIFGATSIETHYQ